MNLTLQFLGASGTVTGSKFLVSDGTKNVMIDCGLFQGLKELRLRNWSPIPIAASSIDAVIVTHAHLDHTGYLPILYKNGFSNPIYCTPPTRDLTKIILEDAAYLQEEEAENANRLGYSKHSPAEPLFRARDAKECLRFFKTIPEDQWAEISPGWKLRLRNSGHILGSAIVELQVAGKTLVFSGDLGRAQPLFLRKPFAIEEADILILESTYGDRFHSNGSPVEELAKITNRTIAKKGHLIIPSFAIGRTQDLLYLFSILKKEKKIPNIPIYLDSPLGINATEIYHDHSKWHSLKENEIEMFRDAVILVKSKQQSAELLRKRTSSIVIAGSGMAAGGRVLQHLAQRLPEEKNTVLLVGFQALGTRGRLLKEGASEVKIYGEYIPVRAEITEIPLLSAHADQREILGWLRQFKEPPQKTFIVHGEPQASDVLRVRIKDSLGWNCEIPRYLGTYDCA
jgi:metallo-beta-lactamase family protein